MNFLGEWNLLRRNYTDTRGEFPPMSVRSETKNGEADDMQLIISECAISESLQRLEFMHNHKQQEVIVGASLPTLFTKDNSLASKLITYRL